MHKGAGMGGRVFKPEVQALRLGMASPGLDDGAPPPPPACAFRRPGRWCRP